MDDNNPVVLPMGSSVYDESADRKLMVDAAEWFGEDDVRAFVYWGDPRSAAIANNVSDYIRCRLSRLIRSFTSTGQIGIEDEVVAHIRRLQDKHRTYPRTD